MQKATAALLLFAGMAFGQTKGPAVVTVPIGRLASIPITLDADEADYVILGAEIDGLREYDPDPKKLKLRVIGYKPGTAFVVVNSVKGGKLQSLFVVQVIVGDPLPPVPPGPGPNPPPVPPAPLDPLATAIRDAAKADGFTRLKELAMGLSQIEAISKGRASWTVADLSTAWKAAMRSAVGGPTSPTVQKILGDAVNAVLPRESEHVLTVDELGKAREVMLRLSKACSEAAK